MLIALDFSETNHTPVSVRSTTRVSHSRSLVEEHERVMPTRVVEFSKNPPRFVPIPLWGRKLRIQVEKILELLCHSAAHSVKPYRCYLLWGRYFFGTG